MGALWVLAVVARPYQWWRVALVAVSGLAYVVIFAIPLAREKFMLDPSNLAMTSIAMGIGLVGAAIEGVVDSGRRGEADGCGCGYPSLRADLSWVREG